MSESTYQRTQVRTRNPQPGVYRSLDGKFEIRKAGKKGCWDVYKRLDGGAEKIASDVRGYDKALDTIVEQGHATVEQLNSPPAKPKPEAVKVEQPESERRSGATGPAPKAPAKGRPHVNRGGRKIA
jgi:hypothetical protein